MTGLGLKIEETNWDCQKSWDTRRVVEVATSRRIPNAQQLRAAK